MTSQQSPRVTICLPTIGRLTYMHETLASLKAQTLPEYELLILYNGSDAGVLERLKEFASQHPGGRVLADDNRMSMFANFNRGLKAARGEYVAFFHDDDVYEPNFLQRTVEELSSHPGAAFAGSNYYIINSDSVVTGHRRLIRRTYLQAGHDFIRELVGRGRGAIPTPGIVFRRSAFDDRGWSDDLSMHFGDFVVLMQMAERHDVMVIAEPLLRIRLHGRNASNVEMSDAAPMLYATLQKYIADFERRWPPTGLARELRSSAMKTFSRFLIWGWLSADDESEARRCTELLRGNGRTALAQVLDAASSLGLVAVRRKGLATAVRRLGRVRG